MYTYRVCSCVCTYQCIPGYSEGFDSKCFIFISEHKRMSIEGLYTTFEASINVSYNTNVLTISDNACTKVILQIFSYNSKAVGIHK